MGTRNLVLFALFCYLSSRSAVPSDAYDPIDPNSNITINWDIQSINNDSTSASTYTVRIRAWERKKRFGLCVLSRIIAA
ncbi:hypothetical protein PR202_gb14828 [Eleusine coracana subsp. coracana]|uniref:Uncharacterized protein n=1 Tax=Eleusine coracana subsp. coracana TaxID=191504 RepID=A0AAV5ETZ0_ELECO|nr:hypothetical protein PR202_gb14828 [Eleusine coracana subsp. coracana]